MNSAHSSLFTPPPNKYSCTPINFLPEFEGGGNRYSRERGTQARGIPRPLGLILDTSVPGMCNVTPEHVIAKPASRGISPLQPWTCLYLS